MSSIIDSNPNNRFLFVLTSFLKFPQGLRQNFIKVLIIINSLVIEFLIDLSENKIFYHHRPMAFFQKYRIHRVTFIWTNCNQSTLFLQSLILDIWSGDCWTRLEYFHIRISKNFVYRLMLMSPYNKIHPFRQLLAMYTVLVTSPNTFTFIFILM